LIKKLLESACYIFAALICLTVARAAMPGQDGQAEPPKIYTIYNIAMDETAATSSKARSIALKKAQHIALDRLFRKILRREDYDSLPVMADAEVSDLVSGLEIAGEKTSYVRYIADFTVHFSRDKIYHFLSARNIPFAETLSRPVSILAVLEKDGTTVLWEKSNDWRAAWREYDTANNLVPVRVIDPSLANRLALTAWQARQGDKAALQKFADGRAIRKLYIMNARIRNDLALGRKTLELTITGTDDEDTFTATIDSGDDAQDLTALYDAAISRATYWLDNRWKEKVLVHFGESSRLKVEIRFDQPEDWFIIRKKLAAISLIRNITYSRLALGAGEVTMEYSGDIEQITLALDQKNLMMTPPSDRGAPAVVTLKK